MLSAVKTNNTNFGMIKLPPKGSNGYKILLKRLKPNEYKELDTLVKNHLKNPVEVEIVGLFDGIRLGANIFDSSKKYLTGDNEYFELIARFRSPLKFIKQTAQKADKIWEQMTKSQKHTSKEQLDKILDRYN